MIYLSRTELENYITLLDGTREYPFIQPDENWILSEVHNRPHDYLAINSDILYTRFRYMTNKLGLSLYQKKNDGTPLWHGCYFLSTGQTYVQALSELDEQIQLLSNMYAQLLNLRGESYFGENIQDTWTITVSNEYSLIDLSNEDKFPSVELFDLFDAGGFMALTRKDRMWSSSAMEIMNWGEMPATITSIFGTSYSFEEPMYSLLAFDNETNISLFAGYQNEVEGSSIFPNYVKRTGGSVDLSKGTISFDSTGTSLPSQYIVDIKYNIDSVLYINKLTVGTFNYIYIVTNESRGEIAVTDRSERIIAPDKIIVYKYPTSDWAGRVRSEGISIEGITYVSYFKVVPVNYGRYGMILTDELGNIHYRESVDGVTWYIKTGSTGLIISNPPGFNMEYACVMPTQNDGMIAFYNMNYENGTTDNLHHAISRDNGKTWENPSFSTANLGMYGLFPQIIRRRNGNIYLLYHAENAIMARRVYIQVATT